MPATLNGLLITLVSLGIMCMIPLFIILIQKMVHGFGNTQRIEITKVPEIKQKVATKSEDNIYTRLAAEEHSKAAEKNLAAQHVALKVAETNQRTEEMHLERVRLEQQGSA